MLARRGTSNSAPALPLYEVPLTPGNDDSLDNHAGPDGKIGYYEVSWHGWYSLPGHLRHIGKFYIYHYLSTPGRWYGARGISDKVLAAIRADPGIKNVKCIKIYPQSEGTRKLRGTSDEYEAPLRKCNDPDSRAGDYNVCFHDWHNLINHINRIGTNNHFSGGWDNGYYTHGVGDKLLAAIRADPGVKSVERCLKPDILAYAMSPCPQNEVFYPKLESAV